MIKSMLSIAICLAISGELTAQVAIQCNDMMIIYAGIPATFKAGANGEYTDVTTSPPMVLASQSQVGEYITIKATGKDKKGNSIYLGEQNYLVKKAPKPELFWNGIAEGGKANKNGGSLSCRYGDNVPFSPSLALFEIISYTITIDGVKGSLAGSGSTISSAHLEVIKTMVSESKINISVLVSGPYNGVVSSSFNH